MKIYIYGSGPKQALQLLEAMGAVKQPPRRSHLDPLHGLETLVRRTCHLAFRQLERMISQKVSIFLTYQNAQKLKQQLSRLRLPLGSWLVKPA